MAKSPKKLGPLTQHLNSLVDEMCHHIPAALDRFEPHSIHQARVGSRRLKAALELLDPQLKSSHVKPLSKAGKNLRRQLGPLRDLDVMIDHLAEFKGGEKVAPAVEWLGRHLEKDRDDIRKDVREGDSPQKMIAKLSAWWLVRQDLPKIEPTVPELIRESLKHQLDLFSQQAEGVCAEKEAIEETPSDPHALRIAGKQLRYTLEIAEAAGATLPKDLLKTFKKLQDFLGTWHDYVVLAEQSLVSSIDAELTLHDPPLQRIVLALADTLLVRAQKELTRFCEFWQQHAESISGGIRSAFGDAAPASEPAANESKTDPDPAATASASTPEPPPTAAELGD